MDIFSVRKRSGEMQSIFWRTPTMSDSDVLAVYQFKGAATEALSLKDLSGHGRDISNYNAEWSASNGFKCTPWRYVTHGIRSDAKSIVLRISGASTGNGALPLCSIGGRSLWLSTPFLTQAFNYIHSGTFGVTQDGNGLSVDYSSGGVTGDLPRNHVRIAGSTYTSGVFGFSYSTGVGTAYRNGSEISLSNAKYNGNNWTGYISTSVTRMCGGNEDDTANGSDSSKWDYLGKQNFAGSFNVLYLAVYNISLSAGQHAAIATLMNDMP